MTARVGYPHAPVVRPQGVEGRLSVVIVHYRGAADLRLCVDSILAQSDPDVEVVVVDNGSPDQAALDLPLDPRVSRIWLPRNLGFAAAANRGLDAASGDLLMLLNPDAALRRGCLRALRAALIDADIAAPRILLAAEPERLDNCGHGLFPDGLNWCRGRGEQARGRYEEAEDIAIFSGAAVAFRRSALARCGALDEAFWAYGEDADLALRAARFGLRCRYVPAAVLTHRVGGSFGSHGLLKAFLVERNRIRIAVTHLPLRWLLASPAWTAARVVALGAGGLGGRGVAAGFPLPARAALPWVIGGAWVAGMLAVPGGLARRRALEAAAPDRARFDALLDGSRVGISEVWRRSDR